MNELLEIERRFLVDARGVKPWRHNARVLHIEQHYLPYEAFTTIGQRLHGFNRPMTTMTEKQAAVWASTDWAVRLRKMNQACILTCKSRQRHDTSLELEWSLSEEDYEAMLLHGPFPSVVKTRYEWTGVDGSTWEVDEFEGALAGVVLAEIELSHSEQEVMLPPWVGHEITGLESWSNKSLSTMLDQEFTAQLPAKD